MKSIRKWMSDRRGRRLREKLIMSGLSVPEAQAAVSYIITGECPEKNLYEQIIRLNRINPDEFKRIYQEVIEGSMARCVFEDND